jgi:hypothetical protein
MRKNTFTPVEAVLNLNDSRLWYYIPGYNGYEISDDYYVRSMKYFKKYPYGILLKPKTDKNGNILFPNDPVYELSNNQNERYQLHLSQIMELAKSNPYPISGYPRLTCVTDNSSRNQRVFSSINKERSIPSFSGLNNIYL